VNRSLLLLATLGALVGCSQTPQQAPEQQSNAVGSHLPPDAKAILAARWAAMFGNPAAVVAAANEFGYGAGAWTRSPRGDYRALGEQALPKNAEPPLVRTSFKVVGDAARQVDAITFTFLVDRRGGLDTREARDAVNIPRRIVAGFLSRFGVSPDDAVRRAVQTGLSATMIRDRGRIVVKSAPTAGGYRSDVTISRS